MYYQGDIEYFTLKAMKCNNYKICSWGRSGVQLQAV
jgi:hypothetical protein